MSNNIHIYNENEPQYKLLQGFANYLKAHTTDRYNFRLENMLFDGGANSYYTGISTEDTKTGDMWQTCTPKAYVTVLQG